MEILAKPSWIGTPIITKPGLKRVGLAIVALSAFSIIVGTVASTFVRGGEYRAIEVFTFTSVTIFSLVSFLVGWFVGIFFWFRCFINFIQASRNRSNEARASWWRHFWIPFFGWRDRDLTEVGKRFRYLAFEGLIGFFVVGAFLISIVLISRLVGLEW